MKAMTLRSASVIKATTPDKRAEDNPDLDQRNEDVIDCKVQILPVYLPQHNVQRSNDRDDVRHHVPNHHLPQRLQIHERRRPHARAIRHRASVADDVVAQFPFRRLDRVVDVADRRLDDLRHLGHERSIRNLFDGLRDDSRRLPHFFHPDHVPIVGIANFTDGNIEIEIRIDAVGLGLAQIPLHAGTAQARPGQPHIDGVFSGDDADILRAVRSRCGFR